ncbi:MAG TPA: ATP synthase F1 subunit delta [Candidatus Binatia bacterium]
MIQGAHSRRYAKALFELAAGRQKEDDVLGELERFAEAMENPELSRVLNNPAFGVESRKRIVVEVARGLGLSPLATHFLALLVERDRLGYFAAIVERYRRLLDEKKGQAQARVVAAAPLEESDLSSLRAALEKISGKKIVIHQESDPALIGGVVVHLEGKIYDGSVRAQLDKMKKQLEQSY